MIGPAKYWVKGKRALLPNLLEKLTANQVLTTSHKER
jgi:hypothetical protein